MHHGCARRRQRTDRLDKLPAGTTMAQFDRESSFDPSARSDAGAMGMAQVMPETLASLQKQLGRKLNPYDANDAVIIQREVMRQNMAKFGNVSDALSAYNKGWDRSKWDNPETRAYAPAIMSSASDFANASRSDDADAKTPGTKAATQAGKTSSKADGSVDGRKSPSI